jgi:hypothetical protein
VRAVQTEDNLIRRYLIDAILGPPCPEIRCISVNKLIDQAVTQ